MPKRRHSATRGETGVGTTQALQPVCRALSTVAWSVAEAGEAVALSAQHSDAEVRCMLQALDCWRAYTHRSPGGGYWQCVSKWTRRLRATGALPHLSRQQRRTLHEFTRQRVPGWH